MRHIKIDALATVIPAHINRLLRAPLSAFSASIAAALCYYSVIFCLDEWEYAPANERWILPLMLFYPISFGLMSLHFIMACFKGEQNQQQDETAT
jgi:TRAP-type C4-dicarboxylate transport system permease small subunit